jgi:hypothetical protein
LHFTAFTLVAIEISSAEVNTEHDLPDAFIVGTIAFENGIFRKSLEIMTKS